MNKILMSLLIGCVMTTSFQAVALNEERVALLGEDKNNNGVRDDVDLHIDKTYKGKNAKRVATMYAKSVTDSIQNLHKPKRIWKNDIDQIGYLECYGEITKNEGPFVPKLSDMISSIMNNKERILAESKVNDIMRGAAVRVTVHGLDACPFKVE